MVDPTVKGNGAGKSVAGHIEWGVEMATKSITANGATGNGVTGTENAGNGATAAMVPARPSGAAGDVWDALTANPGATVTAIADASGASRATVTRALTALERDGRATRTHGGRDAGKRQPDTWHPATTATDPATTDTGDPATLEDAPDTAPEATPAAEADATDEAPIATDTIDTTEPADAEPTGADTGAEDGDAEGAGMDAAAVAEARDALTGLQDAIAAALTALDAGDGAAALTAVEGVYGGSGKARRLVRTAANGRPRNASGKPRSAPGEMRTKVAAHLTAHPGAVFTPHEIAKVIGHSAGAVSNALDRLTEAGEAELVCDRPRRFTATTATR